MDKQTNFDMVLFGATGDLAMRKLLPCLYQAHAAGLLHPAGRILGVSRSRLSRDEFLAKVESDSKIHVKENFADATWADFIKRIDYLTLDVTQPAHFVDLAAKVNARTETDNVVIYLSTAPKFFAPACQALADVGLNHDKVRIVLEKPLGTDLPSCQQINADVAQYFKEEQVYRIDHYLGKESLQNLLPLRFANVFFDHVWHRDFVQSVQITIAEQLGVEERGEFYDITGALRDMVQNHIIQMLCFTAMECPKSLSADDVRDEKMKVLQALKVMSSAEVDANVVRGQYTANDKGQVGYLQEHHVPADSQTETYVAVRAEINNERWQGVPFYLRTGKRMADKATEIVLNFKERSDNLFGNTPNRIVIRFQPEEIKLHIFVKQAGNGMKLVASEMTLNLAQASSERRAEAYELLLREVIDGRLNLFNRRDELEAAWAWVMPIMENWANSSIPPHGYPAASWGSQAARDLLARDGNAWLEDQ